MLSLQSKTSIFKYRSACFLFFFSLGQVLNSSALQPPKFNIDFKQLQIPKLEQYVKIENIHIFFIHSLCAPF